MQRHGPSQVKFSRSGGDFASGPRIISHGLRFVDHITDNLACLHWLHVSEQIGYSVHLTHKALHGSALRYFADLPSQRTLWKRKTLNVLLRYTVYHFVQK